MKKTILFILNIPFIFIACSGPSNESEQEQLPLPEKLVDRIQLVDMEGHDIDLQTYKGKTVFLNFWATWCKPCLAEMPDIDKARQLLPDSSFVFLAASDEEEDRVKKFISRYDFSFQFVRSEVSIFDLDIKALPTTMIINPDGLIVYNEVGARDWASEKQIEIFKKIQNREM